MKFVTELRNPSTVWEKPKTKCYMIPTAAAAVEVTLLAISVPWIPDEECTAALLRAVAIKKRAIVELAMKLQEAGAHGAAARAAPRSHCIAG